MASDKVDIKKSVFFLTVSNNQLETVWVKFPCRTGNKNVTLPPHGFSKKCIETILRSHRISLRNINKGLEIVERDVVFLDGKLNCSGVISLNLYI